MVDLNQEDENKLLMRVNGGINKSKQEFWMEMGDRN